MLQRLKRWWDEFKNAQPAAFKNTVTVERKMPDDAWGSAYSDHAVVTDIRPQLDACATKFSTPGRRVATRYNAAEKRAELFTPDGNVLAKVCAHHGDMVLNRVFIKTEDPELRSLLVNSIAAAHPKVEIRPDELPIPGKWY